MAVEAKAEVKPDGNGAAATEPKFASQISKETREEFAEDLKGYAGKDVNDLARDHLKLARVVKERGIIVPNKDSPAEEVDAFHARMGLPKKAEDYAFTFDEKVLPKEAVEAARAFVFANGYTSKQAQAYLSSLEAIARSAQENSARRRAEGEKNLRANLLQAHGGDEKAADAAYNLAVKHLTGYSQSVRDMLLDAGIAFHPQFLKDIAAVQAKLEPRGLVLGDGPKGETEKKAPQGRQGNYSAEWNALYGKKGA